MRHRPLLLIVLAFSGGIFLDDLLIPSLPLLMGLTLVALVGCWALAFLLQRGQVYMSCCLFLYLSMGAAYHHVRFYSFSNADIGHLVDEEGVLMRIKGVVVEPSSVRALAPSPLPWGEADRGVRRTEFLLRAKALEGRSGWHEVKGAVRVRLHDPEPQAFRYGQTVEFLGKVSAPHGSRNPGQMDYRRYLQGRVPSIRAVASIGGRQNIKVLGDGQGNPFFRAVYFLRERLETGIARSALPGSATTMAGIVWGIREEIPREALEDFIKTGTYHFLAISGMQVGIIVVTLHFSLFLLRVPRRHIAPVVMVLTLLYALLTGFEPPVLRAAFLTVFCYGALLVRREWDLPSGISAAVLATLICNPSDLFNPGFQLSLVGFLGLVYLSVRIESLFWGSSLSVERLQSAGERRRFQMIWIYLRKALCGGVGAWAATAPLVLYYFHLFSPWGAVLSLLLFPLIWILTISGFCLSILGQLSPTAAIPLAYLAEGADVGIKGIVSWTSAMPFTYFYYPSPSWQWLMVFYIAGTLALMARVPGLRPFYVAGALLVIGNVYVYSGVPLWHGKSLEVVVLDVGHGSCIFVEFPNRRTMLYDAGGRFDAGRYVIAPFLWGRGVSRVDVVVVSHEDEDHFNALPFLTEGFGVGRVLVNDHLYSSEKGRQLVAFLEARGIKVEVIREGTELDGLGGARVEVLNPPQDVARLSANEASCVLRVDYMGRSILLCGDIEVQSMGRLMASGARLGADVLVSPHHGGYSPNLGEFLKSISPRYVVVSNRRRSMGHYATPGEVLSTFDVGAISLTIEKRGVKAKGYLQDNAEVRNRAAAEALTQ